MKQSRGAITLLLSALRSVYVNAYIKGLASAVILTGGLAAGAAQATETNEWASSASDVTANTQVVIDVAGERSGDSTKRYTGRIDLSGEGNTYTLDDAGYNLVINGVTVSNGATLKLTGGASIVTGDRLNPDQNEHPIVADTVIRGGNVEIDGTNGTSYFQTHDLVLQDGSLKISGSSTAASDLSGYSQVWMNHGGTFTMGSGSVELTGTALLGADRGMELNGGTLILSGSQADQTLLTVTGGEGAALNIHGADLEVSGKASLMADTINIDSDSSVININASNGALTMGGQTPSQSTATGAKFTSATINMSAGTINNSGSLVIRAGEGTIDWDNTQGDVASFDGDSMNVISLPVGVTLTTESEPSSGWSFVPALDVSVTAHAGDDEFDGDVQWAGVSSLTTATSTEVIDSFTYGISAGLNARNGENFVMGLGLNYEGSANSDAYGVQATARYTF